MNLSFPIQSLLLSYCYCRSLLAMDRDKLTAVSAADVASAVDPILPADAVASAGEGSNTRTEPVEGVLSGVGPSTNEALQIAREKGWTDRVPFEYAELGNKEHRDWAGIAVRYEWKDDYGDVGPPVPELEAQLFHSDLITRAGDKFNE